VNAAARNASEHWWGFRYDTLERRVDRARRVARGTRALEQLCRTYWRPIYSFLRREGRSTEDAQDLTQDFFAQLLERGDFNAVRREKGRLRSYLLGSLKHFLANDRRSAMSLKRGKGRVPISLDELRTEEGSEFESHSLIAERIYDRRWALTVLDQVFARLTNESRNLGHSATPFMSRAIYSARFAAMAPT
jgi:DNA-directed RNA polymerase specialized sigma24 family protein